MLINNRSVRKNKAIKKIQKEDKKTNRDKSLERASSLKKNIFKVVKLWDEEPLQCFDEGRVKEKEVGSQEACLKAIERIDAAELAAKVKVAGLKGMSGGGFPAADKLEAFLEGSKESKHKTILINGAECEPSLLHDAWLMRNKAAEIRRGALYLKNAFAPDKMVLAVRGKTSSVAQPENDEFEIKRVALRYPMGEEHKLMEHALGMKFNQKVIPTEEGIMVTNVQTVYQIGRIMDGTFDGSHYVTLANLKTGAARVACVDDDTNIAQALTEAFGVSDIRSMYAGGGAFRADNISGDDCFSPETAFACIAEPAAISNDNKCHKCGGCSRKCPAGIAVKDIVVARQKNPAADISVWEPEKCLNCGTCTYYCTAGKDPMLYVIEED